MKTANLTDVKNELSKYVAQVRRGASIRILIRGLPVADLVPVSTLSENSTEEFSEQEIMELERRGVIHVGTGAIPRLLKSPGPKIKGSAVKSFLQERNSGR